jgi:tubulin polyglutamylase TTLL9
MGCFPGTYYALYKTAEAHAFRGKSYYPMAYVLPQEADALMQEISASKKAGRKSYYIGKPENECGGEGIRVWEGTDPELAKLVKGSQGKKQEKSVVQRYLADPMLIGGLKFHMRLHMIITSFDPPQAYIQHNGQALFATLPYTLSGKTLGSNFKAPVHVTNQSLNATPANKENYFRKKTVVGNGQQIEITELEKYLAKTYPSYSKEQLWSQILHIGADVTKYLAKAKAVQKFGKDRPKDRHFEIFGLDLMLDKKLNVYMCECNAGPGMDYPDKFMLGEPNPDYHKEIRLASATWNDTMMLLGLDSKRKQKKGSLKSWYTVPF